MVKNPPVRWKMQETTISIPGEEDPLDEALATHSSILALENPMDRGA